MALLHTADKVLNSRLTESAETSANRLSRHSEKSNEVRLFKVIEEIEGNGAFIAELERHLKSKYNRAGLNGFDGYTEWLICTSDLLEELRNLRGKL